MPPASAVHLGIARAQQVGGTRQDARGAGIVDDDRYPGLGGDVGHRQRGRGEFDACDVLHLVAHHQLFGQLAGARRVVAANVLVDDLDGVGAGLAAVLGDVGFRRFLDVLAPVAIWTAERGDDAHPHFGSTGHTHAAYHQAAGRQDRRFPFAHLHCLLRFLLTTCCGGLQRPSCAVLLASSRQPCSGISGNCTACMQNRAGVIQLYTCFRNMTTILQRIGIFSRYTSLDMEKREKAVYTMYTN